MKNHKKKSGSVAAATVGGKIAGNYYNRSLLEASLDPFMVFGQDGKMTDVNSAAISAIGFEWEAIKGRDFASFFTDPEQARVGYETVFKEGKVRNYPLELKHRDGSKIPVHFNAAVYRNEAGKVLGIFASARDITERLSAEARIRQQSNEILELSTPVMQVWKGVVVAPLIGSLDSARTQQFMERLLNRITETNSPVALIDIMGVPTIDTATAQHIIETIAAVRLLGSQVVLTGVRPAIAQTLVHLGVNLSDITTRSSLAAGLHVALNLLNLEVVRKSSARPGEASL